MPQDDVTDPRPLRGGRQRSNRIETHRLELGLKERQYAEALLMTRMYKNVTTGTGAILKPVLDNLQWIISAIIAKEGLEWFENTVDGWNANREASRREWELDAYADYLATNPDNPMSEEEYTNRVTKQSGSYRRAQWWQDNVGQPIRDGLGGLLDTLTFWN